MTSSNRNIFRVTWPFVWGIHRSPVNSPHKGQWRGALIFSLICAWINTWVNSREAGDLRRQRTHYDAIVMGMSYIGILLHCADILLTLRTLFSRYMLHRSPWANLFCCKNITLLDMISCDSMSVLFLLQCRPMNVMASYKTGNSTVCSIVCSD